MQSQSDASVSSDRGSVLCYTKSELRDQSPEGGRADAQNEYGDKVSESLAVSTDVSRVPSAHAVSMTASEGLPEAKDCQLVPRIRRATNMDKVLGPSEALMDTCYTSLSNGTMFVLPSATSTVDAIAELRREQTARRCMYGENQWSTYAGDGVAKVVHVNAMRRALPMTADEFYHTSGSSVYLTVDRDSLMKDALSGFTSIVVREETERLECGRNRENRQPLCHIASYETQGGIVRVVSRPVFNGSDVPLSRIEDCDGLCSSFSDIGGSSSTNRTRSGMNQPLCSSPHAFSRPLSGVLPLSQDCETADDFDGTSEGCLRTHLCNSVPEVFRQLSTREGARTGSSGSTNLFPGGNFQLCRPYYFGASGFSTKQFSKAKTTHDAASDLCSEWPHVWAQFVRDVPRETLFIDEVAYDDPRSALAAIHSYVEYCFDRARAARSIKVTGEPPALSGLNTSNGGSDRGTPWMRGVGGSILSSGANVWKTLVAQASTHFSHHIPVVSTTAGDAGDGARTPTSMFPKSPAARTAVICTAVREVVLASQQSFLGFPYQLLCEQVGMHHLPLMVQEGTEDEPRRLPAETDAVRAEGSATEHCAASTCSSSASDAPVVPHAAVRFSRIAQRNATGLPSPNFVSKHDHTRDGKVVDRVEKEGVLADAEFHKSSVVGSKWRARRGYGGHEVPLVISEPRKDMFKAFLDLMRRRMADQRLGATMESSIDSVPVDIDGNVFVLPRHPSCSDDDVSMTDRRGTHIHLRFDTKLNTGVVTVDRVFQLFPVPGFSPPTSATASCTPCQSTSHVACPSDQLRDQSPHLSALTGENSTHLPTPDAAQTITGLLLLMHVEFALFIKDKAHVRWQWWSMP